MSGTLLAPGEARQGVGVAGEDVRLDITAYLTLWLILLFAISAYQRIGPLGAIGQPSLVVAAGAALAWVASRFVPSMHAYRGVQPMRVALFVYAWYLLATLVRAHTRSMTVLEQTGSVREAIMMLSMVGLALAVMDGSVNLDRLETLLRRLVWAGAWLAGVGIVQFITGASLTLRLPGLTMDGSNFVGIRSIFNRPSGTSQHPIEFSVILAALLPLALYFALESESGSRRQKLAIAASFMIALGVPLAISRSGILAIVVALGILGMGWSWRRRVQAMLVAIMSVPVLWLTIPGLVGTFRSMFGNYEYDPSVQARLDRIPRVMELIREYPLFGRGVGTFSPEDYLLLDSDIWVMAIELGIVGLVLSILFYIFAMVVAITSRHHVGATSRTAHLGYAIAGGIGAVVTSFFTFDTMFFVQVRGVTFLLIGAAGALWRLTRNQPESPHAVAPSALDVDGMTSLRS